MAEYIEREAVLKIIADNCPHDKGGYNTEEEMGAGSACYYIRRAVETVPTADVVPMAEIFEIFEEIEKLAKIYTFPVVKKGIAEIEKEPFLCIEPSDFAELKKKYTEDGK